MIPDENSCLADWLDYLSRLHTQEIDLGLERVREVAQRMNLLHPIVPVFTVAGTNGKGSSVAMLVSILNQAGYRVGSYTSPHILRFNERIQINGVSVDDHAIVQAFSQIERNRHQTKLTYFEYATLAALEVFARNDLDAMVLEVGMGGRLDAVNIVDADYALITAIDIDHIEWLGNNREDIGFEKAGVLRATQSAVCSDPNPPESLLKHAQTLGTQLKCLNRDFEYEKLEGQRWAWRRGSELIELPFPALAGDFQLQNASGVIALLQMQKRFLIDSSHLSNGLLQVNHPGRLQTLHLAQQAWLLDVAHNPQSVEVLGHYLAKSRNRYIAIFAALADKDMASMMEKMNPYIEQWVWVELHQPRASESSRFLNQTERLGCEGVVMDSMSQAIAYVQSLQNRNVLVFGSFLTVAQALESLNG